MNASARKTPSSPHNEKLDYALSLMRHRAYNAAEPILRQLEKAGEPSPEVSYSLGVITFGGGHLLASQKCFQRTLVRAPRHANALFYLGMVERRLGNETVARARFAATLAIDPRHRGALEQSRRRAPPQGKQPSGAPLAAPGPPSALLTELVIPQTDAEVANYAASKIAKNKADMDVEIATGWARQQWRHQNREALAVQAQKTWGWQVWFSWHGRHPVQKVFAVIVIVAVTWGATLAVRGVSASMKAQAVRTEQAHAEFEETKREVAAAHKRQAEKAVTFDKIWQEGWDAQQKRFQEAEARSNAVFSTKGGNRVPVR